MSTITLWLHEIDELVPRELVADRFARFAAGEPVPRIELELTPLDKDGQALAPPVRVHFPNPEMREHAAGGGDMAAEPLQPPLGAKIEQKFRSLKVARDGKTRIFDRDEVTDDVPETRKSVRLVTGGTGWVLVLVAELFDRWDDFHAVCREFIEYVLKTPPFDDKAIKPLIGFELLFAPAGANGLFGTREAIRVVREANAGKPDHEHDRRIYGNNKSVMDFLKTMRWQGRKAGGNMILVVVNSDARGGAGGAGNGTPTWSTTTGGAHEDWKDVALHELGHSFGLADEYFSASGANIKAPAQLEPNVSRHADPALAPWTKYWPDRAKAPWAQPPHNTATLDRVAGDALDLHLGRRDYKDIVGSFQGARYEPEKLYRPAFDCRMRHTNTDFCPCCREVIKATIVAAAAP